MRSILYWGTKQPLRFIPIPLDKVIIRQFSRNYIQNNTTSLDKRDYIGKSTLDENTLVEKFVKGTGPGGQSVNKTRNCVQLTHSPTGISVQCHQQRDLTSNRKLARRWLQEKIELEELGKNSKLGKRIEKKKKRKRNAARRARKKYGSAAEVSPPPDKVDDVEGGDDNAEQRRTLSHGSDGCDSGGCDSDGCDSNGSDVMS
eukprot:CAMPEP_0114421726 /NCGR_PEP_ID=MMETSP0103-20121206/5232_1 /TAXON_ID=37642 ORGANISM="Paraphysomonas imperforata, Strain PA2" /NCGR_SAMPLE_ID=MMETSP0103 /ASSEMBLY_ACC=CAM_ASM_000201 /LENGTH=200 /DNA_ID=CAMNT_0001590267 /DNA_START=157 /DNA_END=759 /DNA_ORIENTATION=+